jgi:hypothetical protein
MAGLVPAIHVLLLRAGLEKTHAEILQDVDGRDKPGHDGDGVAEVGTVIASEAKQSIPSLRGEMDWFACVHND